jgi:uncharacterized membrane protein YfcA
VIDPAWFSLFDVRFVWAAIAAALAGLVRGFSGFGGALTFIPLAAMAYEPRVAIIGVWIADLLAAAPFVPYHLKRAAWSEMRWLFLGTLIALPPGVWVLANADPTPLRWALCLFVLACTAALASGWRYRGRPRPMTSGLVGAVAGFCNGSVGIGGPPVVLFWLAGQNSAAQARSNIFAYLLLVTIVAFGLYGWQGIFAMPIVTFGIALTPFYMGALKLGDILFRHGSEALFRRTAFALCGAAGVLGLPVWG